MMEIELKLQRRHFKAALFFADCLLSPNEYQCLEETKKKPQKTPVNRSYFSIRQMGSFTIDDVLSCYQRIQRF